MNTARVVSDILGMDSESDWNASDEEDYVEAEASFHIPDRLLREQEGKMADSVQNCKYRLHFCTNIIGSKESNKEEDEDSNDEGDDNHDVGEDSDGEGDEDEGQFEDADDGSEPGSSVDCRVT